MIAFENVTKRYGERLALDDVTWRMEEGECAVVLGHSAAGKTTHSPSSMCHDTESSARRPP